MPYSVRPQNKKKESNEVKTKELNELRKENQKLKRENARLRSDLDKYLNWVPDDILAEENLAQKDPSGTPMKEIVKSFECPECKSTEITQIKVGPKTLRVCTKCNWRAMK